MAVTSDTLRLAVVEEVTVGVTPATPAWDLIRTTGEGLSYTVNTTQSDEMGGINRGVKDNILVGAEVTGDVAFEMSKHVALEDLIAACLGNDWAADPLSVPGAGTDKVYDFSTRRTFSFEKRFTIDSTPTYNYHRFTGCLVDTMSISITPNEPITGSWGFIGSEMTTEAAEVVASTYAIAGTAPIMTAPLVTGIELLSPAGIDDTTGAPLGSPVAWLNNACFTGLDMSFNNNGRGLACIGELGVRETVLGRFEVTATGSLYYAADEPLDSLITQEEFALQVTMTDDNGDNFQWLFPRITFSAATALASGTNTDVMTEFTFQMLEYQGDDYALTLMLSRSSPATILTAKSATKPATKTKELTNA